MDVTLDHAILEKIDQDRRQERKETIERMYMECYTAQEIAEVVGLAKSEIHEKLALIPETEMTSKNGQSANFTDDFEPPIYNIWKAGNRAVLPNSCFQYEIGSFRPVLRVPPLH